MKLPTKDAALAAVAHQIAAVLVTLPVLVAIWAGAAYFGVELPRPAWRAELDRQACRTARLEKDLYGPRARREEERAKRLNEVAIAIPPEDGAARWRARVDAANAEDDARETRAIADSGAAAWRKCLP